MRRCFLSAMSIVGLASVAACAPSPSGEGRSSINSAQPSFVAKIETSGYATIVDAPPAPFTAVEPTEPAPPTAAQIAEQEQFTRVGRFQSSVRDEVQSIVDRLRSQEPGNFVSVYFDNEGDPSVVFQFLRNGPETLRKYSRHPRFFGKTVRWSRQQLLADQDYMINTFAADRVIAGAGIGRNEVNVDLLVSEPEFRALVARKGIKLPESVELRFLAAPIVPLIQPKNGPTVQPEMPPEVARLIRIFPRNDRPDGMHNAINSRAKIVLRDGCFRLADRGDALALFPLGAQLFVDTQGYLAFGSQTQQGYARVGEVVEFPGSITEVTTPELVDPIHAACGPGKVIKVTALMSASASNAQQRITDEYNAVRRLRDEYGLSADQARRAIRFLDERQATQPSQKTTEGMSLPPVAATDVVLAPPPPPAPNTVCPAGSKISFGLCRTPEGHLRPLPDWLTEFLEKER